MLLLSLLLLSQSKLSLQLRVTQLRLPSITPNALKSAEKLLLSWSCATPHVQTARMPTDEVVPDQSLEVVLLLPGTEPDLRPARALEIGIIRLLLLRETV